MLKEVFELKLLNLTILYSEHSVYFMFPSVQSFLFPTHSVGDRENHTMADHNFTFSLRNLMSEVGLLQLSSVH